MKRAFVCQYSFVLFEIKLPKSVEVHSIILDHLYLKLFSIIISKSNALNLLSISGYNTQYKNI